MGYNDICYKKYRWRALLGIGTECFMEKEKIDRINELGRLAKQRPLTEEETAERAALREEYLRFFRAGLRGETTDNGGNK